MSVGSYVGLNPPPAPPERGEFWLGGLGMWRGVFGQCGRFQRHRQRSPLHGRGWGWALMCGGFANA